MAQIIHHWEKEYNPLGVFLARLVSEGHRIHSVIPTETRQAGLHNEWNAAQYAERERFSLCSAVVISEYQEPSDTTTLESMTAAAIAHLQSQGLIPS